MSRYDSSHPFKNAHEGYFIAQADGSVDACDDDPVHVAIVMDVQGYGPYHGSLYVDQNRYHGSEQSALEAAYEMHEQWMRDTFPDELKDLEKERLEEHVTEYLDEHRGATKAEAIEAVQDDAYQEAEEWFRANMNATTWKMSAQEFIEAIDQWPTDRPWHADSKKVRLDGVSITREDECD